MPSKQELKILQATKSIKDASFVPGQMSLSVKHTDVAQNLGIEDYRVARFFDALVDSGHLITSPRERRPNPNEPLKFRLYQVDLTPQGLQAIEHPEDLQDNILIKREGIFFDGQQYDAFYFIGEIISDAKAKLIVIDGYIDETVFPLLSHKRSEVELYVLIKGKSDTSKLRMAASKFNSQYKNLFLRKCEVFHDRFVIVDDKDYYHLGASLNHLGKRVFMFSRIEEPEVTIALKNKWLQEWNSATKVN